MIFFCQFGHFDKLNYHKLSDQGSSFLFARKIHAEIFLIKRKVLYLHKIMNMELRRTFQSIIASHQEELPFNGLVARNLSLPVSGEDIVTVTGIRRCGKSSLLRLTINKLLSSGIPKENILYVEFDDERFSSMQVSDFDDILQAYRDMHPEKPLKDAYMFLMRYS